MTTLTNARHEKFAQGMAKGMTATDAYVGAGYKANGPNAARLSKDEEVISRVAELQGSTAEMIVDVRDAARKHTHAAVGLLADIIEDTGAPTASRVNAASIILDRGHGKAVQHIEAEVNLYDSLEFSDKLALLAALKSLDDGQG